MKLPIRMFLFAVIFVLFCLAGCSKPYDLSAKQHSTLNELLFQKVTDDQIEAVKIGEETARKFPAVEKSFKVALNGQDYYVFIVVPTGYRSVIQTMVVINAKQKNIQGIKVLEHDETPGYGDWLTEGWFAGRFKGKSVDQYLVRTILEANNANEIIQITGATVSTQAVINGVNAAFGAYREAVLGEKAEAVPLRVEDRVTEQSALDS